MNPSSHASTEATGSAPLTSLTPTVTSASPPVTNKRPRPVLSCLECRRKKLKCDRLLPCNQCNKSGHSAQCAYYNRRPSQAQALLTESEGEAPPRKRRSGRAELGPPQRDPATSKLPDALDSKLPGHGVLEDLQARVAKIEGLLSGQSSLLTTQASESANYVPDASRVLGGHHGGILSLKGSRTRYFGPSHKLALLSRFEMAMDFCKRGFPGLSPIMDEFRRYQKFFSKKNKAATAPYLPPLSSSSAYAKMQEILPSRSLCDRLVGSYVYNGEKSLRILHIPSFLRECQQFWEDPESLVSSVPGFIPQLFAVMLIGSSWDPSGYFPAKLAEHGLTKVAVCKMITVWLDGLNWKRRTELATLRIQTLMLLANQLCLALPLESIWNSSAELVRSAMTMGLHHDPSEFPDISIFEGEQRRRLWMSIVELDLQGSLISGCPGMVREGDYTCAPPANVDDLQLFEEMIDYPASKPIEEWTDTSCQVVLARSLSLRLQAMSLANNISAKPDYKAFLKIGAKLEALLRGLPPVIKFDFASSSGSEGPGRLIGRLILDLFIRRLLVCLYRPFALAASEDETFLEGRRACIRTCLMLLCRQDSFDPSNTDLTLITTEKYWDVYNVLLRTDILQAALTICLEIKAMGEGSLHGNDVQEQLPSYGSVWQKSPSMAWTKAGLIKAVENTLNSLLRRIGEPGTDLRDPLALSMVLQAARADETQESTDDLMRAGANTVLKTCRHHFQTESGFSYLEKPNSANLGPVPLNTPPAGVDDLGYDNRPVSAYSNDFPANLDMDTDGLEFDLGIDWDWGETWA